MIMGTHGDKLLLYSNTILFSCYYESTVPMSKEEVSRFPRRASVRVFVPFPEI